MQLVRKATKESNMQRITFYFSYVCYQCESEYQYFMIDSCMFCLVIDDMMLTALFVLIDIHIRYVSYRRAYAHRCGWAVIHNVKTYLIRETVTVAGTYSHEVLYMPHEAFLKERLDGSCCWKNRFFRAGQKENCVQLSSFFQLRKWHE